MFVYDEDMTAPILSYCNRRLALDPVPLDFPGTKDRLDKGPSPSR